MNVPLRRVGLAMMVMIVLLLGNASFVQVIQGESLRTDDGNKSRVLYGQYARQRGQIIAADNTILAQSVPTNDSLKYIRQLPNGEMYAPVTGYYSVIYGASGMEYAEDDVLNGSDDRLFVRRLSDLITGRDPRGGHLQLTIEPKLQATAFNELKNRGFTGSVVAIRPQTGEILAMANSPSYDPNVLASHDGQAVQKAYNDLIKTPGGPMKNRAVSETYQPGSTFKLVVAAAALANGVSKDEQLTADAHIPLNANTDLENFGGNHCGPGGDATVSMETALALSCNTAFATLAADTAKVGAQRLMAQAAKFGIGQTDLKIPISVAPSSLGQLSDNDSAGLKQSGIGQLNVRMTPLQDAMVVATIANGGKRMQPQLVKAILAPDLSTIEGFSAEAADTAMTGSDANTLRDMMKQAEDHAGSDGKVSGLTIASKTGTAEHGTDPKNTQPYGWYVAFAPADNPQIAIAVFVESGGSFGLKTVGANVAAPVGRAVIRAALGGG